MALSNWDTLAFNLNGPCSGKADAGGWRVEIYKNWLYVHHDDVLVTTIQDASMRIGTWEIRARRGPQEGIYLVAWSAQLDADGTYRDKALLVGCGVYGFTDPADDYADLIATLGVDPALVGTVYSGDQHEPKLVAFTPEGGQIVIAERCRPAEFVGVQPASVQYLRDVVDEVIKENTVAVLNESYWPGPELAVIDWDHALRANQGDMFFESRAGTEVTGTPPGEADTPVLLQALQPGEDAESPS
jgi:hypothetical protein